MSDECVVAAYRGIEQAQLAIHILRRGDFPAPQISLVTSDPRARPEFREDLELGDDSVHDAAVGAGLGAVAGVLAGIASMFVSGMGLVFLAGPIGGGIVGAAAGAFLGGLAGWGVHKEKIGHYEQLVKSGGVLVIAHGNPLQLIEAERMLRETDAHEVHVHARTESEAPEVRD